MFKNLHITNPDAFIKAFENLDGCTNHIAEISSRDFEAKQFETAPIKGYETPEGFPNCCEGHKAIYNIGLERFSKFPNCCEHHKKLNGAKWFRKDNYSYLPIKLAQTVAYTCNCIAMNLEKSDWYKIITDYIDYTFYSFGQFPDGYGSPFGVDLYLHNVENTLKNEKEIPEHKKKQLISFIQEFGKSEKTSIHTDLNILIGIYKKWFKEFPFEISFFQDLKPHFEKQIPILYGKEKTNIFTGLVAYKTTTKEQLINYLISITENILSQTNTLTLYESNLLTDPNKIKLELILNERKMKLKQGYSNNSAKEDDRYRKILKDWFNDEKKFIDEITPLLKTLPTVKKDLVTVDLPNEISEIEQAESDGVNATIVDWLFPFFQQKHISEKDYKTLISAMEQYLRTKTFPEITKPILITGRLNKKRLGWALNQICAFKNIGIEKDLLRFAKANISLFSDLELNENEFSKSNLYRYFTTKTQ